MYQVCLETHYSSNWACLSVQMDVLYWIWDTFRLKYKSVKRSKIFVTENYSDQVESIQRVIEGIWPNTGNLNLVYMFFRLQFVTWNQEPIKIVKSVLVLSMFESEIHFEFFYWYSWNQWSLEKILCLVSLTLSLALWICILKDFLFVIIKTW